MPRQARKKSVTQTYHVVIKGAGHVMDGRYFSEPVDTAGYLLRAVRYIHFNPTKAGLESSPGTDYPWSSFFDYQRDSAKLADTEQVLSLTGGRETFLEMHNYMVEEECLDIDKCRKRVPDDVAVDIILQQCKCDSVKELQEFPQDERNQIMVLLYKKGISIRQLSRLTGIPKGVIERAINKALKIETKEASLK